MRHILKKLMVATLVVLLLASVPVSVLAATNNDVDKVPTVKVDHEFTGDTAPTLYIEEVREGEFRGEAQRIRLVLVNAEWTDRQKIEEDITFGGDAAGITDVYFLSDTMMQISLVPEEESNEVGWWRIPLYTEITGGAYASVRIDPLGARVSADTFPFAEVLDGRPGEVEVTLLTPNDQPLTTEPGENIDANSDVSIQFIESEANTISSVDTVFRLELTNAQWFANSVTRLNAAAMERNADVEGNHEVELEDVERINNRVLEVTFKSDGFSDEPAEITIPLYFEVTDYGEVTLEVSLKDSRDSSAEFTVAVSEAPEPEEPEITEVTFAVGQLGYSINNDRVASDAAPFIQTTADGLGRIMVPVRFVSDAVGADSVRWDPTDRKVYVTKGDIDIEMMIGNNILLVNGIPRVMDAVAEIQDIGGGLGRTMVPVAHLARALDVEYDWNETTRTVTFMVENNE